MSFLNKKIAIFALLLIITYLFLPFSVQAADACTATVDPTSVTAGSSATMSFEVTNSGDTDVIYIKVTRPSGDFTLYNTGGVPSPWSGTYTASYVEISGGTISPGGSLSFSFGANIGENEATSANWLIEIYGSDFATCTGTLGTAITGAGDTTGPSLSQPSTSGITNSSATITWTTDESSTSVVDYGKTLSYGSTLSDETMVTSHSITLTGLSADTTYYYTISSTDAAGNSSSASGYNFTTASANTTTTTATPTPTPTPTPTSTAAATATPTATPFVDRVSPSVEITTEFADTYESPPFIEGTATDAIGVTQIDFSIDGGANWLPVGDVEDLGATSATFAFTPDIFEDGNYEIQVRALDDAGNTGTSDIVTVVIDRLPPRVGGNLLSLGPLSLAPNENGVIVTIPGLEQRVTLSTVGGATSVDLLTNDTVSSLGFNPQTGLWTGALNFPSPGEYQVSTRAVDGAGNRTERDLNKVVVVDPGAVRNVEGRIVENGEITVFVQNPQTRLWSVWNGSTFGQDNPQNLIDGEYQYFLPPGTYYLTITSSGNPKLTSKIFTVEQTRPVTVDFQHVPRATFGFGPIQIPLPSFMSEKASVKLSELNFEGIENPLVGQNLPRFNLPSTGGNFSSSELIGERVILTFISTWSPASLEQMPILNAYLEKNSVSGAIILSQESLSKAIVFRKRGKYTANIIADPDGELVEEYAINFLPMHFFVNRRGVVQKVVTGVLTEDELNEHLSDL